LAIWEVLTRRAWRVGEILPQYNARIEMLKAWALHDAGLYRAFSASMLAWRGNMKTARILDIGCGANAPMTLMLHSAGVRVIGVDEYVGHRWGLGFKASRYLSYRKEVGIAKTARKMAGELIYDRHYYATLREELGFPLSEEGIDLRRMHAETLQFADGAFDIVYSNATWEHIANVRAANQEVARVLSPGGIAYVEIHLFPSLSGGHDLPWIVPGKTDIGDIHPWGHLRDPAWRPPVHLNRLRERDYHRLFEETTAFEMLEWRVEFTEGEELVTEAILRDLPDYSREELTKRSIIVVLRRK
jgi:SAM-dependent methyltransferase